MDRAELIATLVADRYSGFKAGDESILETCSDARLEEFRAASDKRRVDEQTARNTDTELTKANARLKVAESKLVAAQEAPSEEEWLAKAPPKYKALIDADRAEEDSIRASMITSLKDLGQNTEEELKAMPTENLRQLAAYARVTVPDYSGRGVAKDRYASAKSTQSYAPPDPWGAGLEKLRKESKTVN